MTPDIQRVCGFFMPGTGGYARQTRKRRIHDRQTEGSRMAVYVDEIKEYPKELIGKKARKYGRKWCHLMADTPEELNEFAKQLGLHPRWIQKRGTRFEHFDLSPGIRHKAVKLGAVEVTSRQMVEWAANRGRR